uniref:Uncharacterized protein n=1 Tax=Arundo donax TaxID=35708 RepID=A0A0A9HFN7_ARUDO
MASYCLVLCFIRLLSNHDLVFTMFPALFLDSRKKGYD